MQETGKDKGPEEDSVEEQEEGNTGCLSTMWDKGLQNGTRRLVFLNTT